MPLITVVLTICAVGVFRRAWLVNRFIPMQGQVKGILNGVVVDRSRHLAHQGLWIASLPYPVPRRVIANAFPRLDRYTRQRKTSTMQHGRVMPKGIAVRRMLLFVIGSAFSLSVFAQANMQATVVVESAGPASPYDAVVISRTVQAADYLHRGGATEVDLAGTTLDDQ